MGYLQRLVTTIILGVIQGFTEWLPISSSGHLKLVEVFLGFEVSYSLIFFDVVLHVGTLIVIIVFFREQIAGILSDFVRLDFKTERGRMVPLTIVGVLPSFLVGLVISELMVDRFQSVLFIGGAFLLCGVILYSSKFGTEDADSITYPMVVLIGIAQGIALLPGISRSGVTIAIPLLLGVKRERSFNFSFIISIPAILGALFYTAYTEFEELASVGTAWNELFLGAIVSMFVGYFALKLLWKTVARRKFYLFSFYCWLIGGTVIFIQVFSAI